MRSIFPGLGRVMRVVALIAAMNLGVLSSARADHLTLPSTLIDFGSPEGIALFTHAGAKVAYWPLASEFLTQKTQSYCGVASLAMVLNALEVPGPAVPDYGPFTSFTQDNLFSPATDKIIRPDYILNHGMTLDQVGAVAASYGVTVQIVHASASSIAKFRAEAAAALARRGHHVIVNYLRTALGQQKYGHISPLAAYDRRSDRFLVMDVARYKYPPFWVRTADLFAAMDTVDAGNANQTRGFLLLDYARH
jgi:Phytochelatin synthase